MRWTRTGPRIETLPTPASPRRSSSVVPGDLLSRRRSTLFVIDFLALIGSALSTDRERCQPVPGAAQMLSVLRAHPDFECAVATGAWRESALLKTRCAGLAIEDLPLVTADDSPRREEILERAVERARAVYRLSEGADAIYVGDGVWDLRAAEAAGLHFLGVGNGSHASALRAAGASNVIEDFSDIDHFLELLNGVVA